MTDQKTKNKRHLTQLLLVVALVVLAADVLIKVLTVLITIALVAYLLLIASPPRNRPRDTKH